MTDWNPVKGLKKMKWTDLRTGDDVVQQSNLNMNTFIRIRNVQPYGLSRDAFYYLIERPIAEPDDRGDVAGIYRTNPTDSGEDQVEIYIRVRPKFMDEVYNSDEAWTDAQNNVTVTWEEIVRKSKKKQDFKLRIFKATYKEDV